MIDIGSYFEEIRRVYATGQATEHSYRPALQKLFKSIDPNVDAVNEPKGVKVGRPDFVFIREAGKGTQITVGHCEAKDPKVGLNPKTMDDFNKAQYDRYVKALPNLIYTNGLDFAFYKNGQLARQISIGDLLMGFQPKTDQFSVLANQLNDFAAERLQTITSAEKLAEMMAGKAKLIKDILFNSLKEDNENKTDLVGQYQSFKKMLIHDLTSEDFADIYAETVAYGMFGARLHDKTLENFSRAEALELMPKSNPFLRYLFNYIAGPDLDERIRRTIDELAEIFQATNLPLLFEDFGKFTQRNDPFIHFYETFLAEYNPAKRKARGVWYTPEPVVNFIVRAVDDVLKTEFGLADGLADTSKVTVDWDTGETKNGKAVTNRREVHRVQILDPAAGTGTFLAEVIKQIAPRVKDVAEGQWSNYVEKELIPRLHGFELLMASYAMCHMKLDMMLTEMGYKPTANPPRMGVYLTNSLEEGDREIQDLFWAKPLSEEAKQANTIKRDMPIMCVIGNPPYSGESANKGDWIMGLMEAYKKEPGGKEKLKERNPKWINDDYVKFIRFAEHLIEKNGEGVLGFITNHGYLDNPTFRGMRWHLLKTFDKIWVLDLHGNSNRKETAPDGRADKNVFDIMQGVALIIATKSQHSEVKAAKLGQAFHGEVWGERSLKYDALWKSNSAELSKYKLPNKAPQYPFVIRDFNLEVNYKRGFGTNELMPLNSVGIVTARDELTIDLSWEALWERVQDFAVLDGELLRKKYHLGKDVRDWKVAFAKADVIKNLDQNRLTRISYRPLDPCWTFYTGNSKGFHCYPRSNVMGNYIRHINFGLLVPKGIKDKDFAHVFVTSFISEAIFLSGTTASNAMNLPLYIYPDEQSLDQTRRVNFDPKIRKAIEAAATGPSRGAAHPPQGEGKLTAPQGEAIPNSPHPEVQAQLASKDHSVVPDEVAIFDYIYGVLHCPAYRETYKEFLKIDFPRVPYPPSPDVFWDVSTKGTQLRKLHLMEDAAVGAAPYKFVGDGDSKVVKVEFRAGITPQSPLSPSDSSPNKLGERINSDPPSSLLGEVPEGRRGSLPQGQENEFGAVFINPNQSFENVPRIAWEFYIGGYQPAQKWLKDRKGRELSFDDIKHYQKIIKILSETDKIMKTIVMPL